MLELKTALRRIRRRPGRPLATALTLSIGVGATTTAFAAVDRVLWRDLPVDRQDELVVAWLVSDRTSIRLPYDGLAFDAVAAGPGSLSIVGGFSAWGALPVLVETRDDAYALNASYVAGDYFGVLGARPELGRLLTAADDEPGAAPAVVLSHDAWRTRYSADPALVGSTVVLAGRSATVVGVAPAGFDHPRGTEVWYPLRVDYADPGEGPPPELHLIGRMAPGVDHDTVADDIDATLAAGARTSGFMSEARTVVRGLEEELVGSVEPVLYAGFGAALLLLLAAAANATLFVLAGGRSAAHEVAVRTALGAERVHLLSRLLADSSLVAALAGVGGVAVAWSALSLLAPLAPPELPRLGAAAVGGRAVGFAALTSVVLALMSGTLAALLLSRSGVRTELSAGVRGAVGGGSRLRRAVAGVQVALAVVSASGAGLLVRTVIALDALEPGFSARDMTAVSLWVPYPWFDVPESYLLSLEEVVGDLESRPGVVAARPSLGPPLQQRLEVVLRAEGQSDEDADGNPAVAVDAVLPGHFRALDIPMRSGRGITELDNRPDASPVVVVDEALASALWPGEDPLGRTLVGYPGWNDTAFTVVGVVAATRYREYLETHPRAYYPLRLVGNSPPSAMIVRTADGSVPVRSLVAGAFAAAHPSVRVLEARRMSDVLRQPTLERRFASAVLVSFGGATLLLAALGVYGVFTMLVQERTREMGVRRALGAQRARIVRMVLGGVSAVAVTGAAAGVLCALWAGRMLRSLLYGVSPGDPLTLGVVAAACLLLALSAGLAPALRASSVSPAVSLRAE